MKQNRIDLLASQLCDEIDYYKTIILKLQKENSELKCENSRLLNEGLEHNQKMIGNMLTIMLHPDQIKK